MKQKNLICYCSIEQLLHKSLRVRNFVNKKKVASQQFIKFITLQKKNFFTLTLYIGIRSGEYVEPNPFNETKST
jgi:hypothetical protein